MTADSEKVLSDRHEAMLRFLAGGIAAGLTHAELLMGMQSRWPDYTNEESSEINGAISRRLEPIWNELVGFCEPGSTWP